MASTRGFGFKNVNFGVLWDAKTMEVKTLKKDPVQRVEWRAVGK